MKAPQISILMLLLGFSAACAEHTLLREPKLVRVMYESKAREWKILVQESGGTNSLHDANLTNQLFSLNLKAGDIIIWADSPDDSSSPLSPLWRWVMDNCVSNRQVAVHFQLSIPPEKFFTQPIFHWTTPLDYPRHLPDACFFYQGRFLGSGKDGFESMLKEITRLRPASTYILGSQYTDKSPRVYIPMMPFEKELRRLDDLTKELGSSLTCLEYGWPTNR